MDYTNNKQFSPLSPCYTTTSDLSLSPRSLISCSGACANGGLLSVPLTTRSFQNVNGDKKSIITSDYGDSDIGGSKDFLNSTSFLLSPTPYSPLSDYNSETPFWSPSPNLSPLPTSLNNLHFK